MKEKIKILLLPDTPFPNNRPMLISLWNTHFSSRGHNLVWIMKPTFKSEKLRKFSWGKSELYLSPSNNGNSLFAKIFNHLSTFFFQFHLVKKILENNDIDIIHAHDGFIEGTIARLFSKKYNTHFSFGYTAPFVRMKEKSVKESSFLKALIRYPWYLFVRKLYSRIFIESDLIFSISKKLGIKIAEEFSINPEKIQPVPESASNLFLSYKKNYMDHSKKSIIYLGSVKSDRKLEFLIDTFNLVLQDCPETNLIILGGNKFDQEVLILKNYAKQLKIRHKVEFIDKVVYGNVPEILSQSSIGISPIPPVDIFLDSTPTKAIDYLSLGLPVVLNEEIHDQKELLEQSGGGILVKYDTKSFAEAIIWLLENPEKAKEMGQNGRKWLIDHRNFESLSEKIESKYFELMKIVPKIR